MSLLLGNQWIQGPYFFKDLRIYFVLLILSNHIVSLSLLTGSEDKEKMRMNIFRTETNQLFLCRLSKKATFIMKIFTLVLNFSCYRIQSMMNLLLAWRAGWCTDKQRYEIFFFPGLHCSAWPQGFLEQDKFLFLQHWFILCLHFQPCTHLLGTIWSTESRKWRVMEQTINLKNLILSCLTCLGIWLISVHCSICEFICYFSMSKSHFLFPCICP